MPRLFIIALTSAALTFTSLIGSAAHADQRDTARILAGLAVLGIIGAAIASDNDDNDRDRSRVITRRDPPPRIMRDPKRGWGRRALPAQCLRTIETRRGLRDVYGKHCLKRNFKFTKHLPDRCEREAVIRGRERTIYGARCLRREGWTVAQRY